MMTCTAEGLLQDLTALVEDLQVVSYKWLARQYHIPSNFAKQVLYRFVEEQGSNVKAIYLVSGYLKAQPSQHVVRLIDGSSLAECQAEFATLTGVHVHSVMPIERQPVTDAGRLCAEDTEQARLLYKTMVKGNAAVGGSADVFAKNATSSITFGVDIQPLEREQQQLQPQQEQPQPQTGAKSPAGFRGNLAAEKAAAAAAGAVAARAQEEPRSKRQMSAATDTMEADVTAEGTWQVDPISGQEVWMDVDQPEQQQQQGQRLDALPAAQPLADGQDGAAGGGNSAGLPHTRPAAAAGVAAAAAAADSGKVTSGRAGGSRGGGRKSGKSSAGSGKTQKNITSFFGKS